MINLPKGSIHFLAYQSQSKEGGMGFQNIRCFNLAMLAKQAWRLLQDNGSLLYECFKSMGWLYYLGCLRQVDSKLSNKQGLAPTTWWGVGMANFRSYWLECPWLELGGHCCRLSLRRYWSYHSNSIEQKTCIRCYNMAPQ